jgi:hypothetical protein
MNIIIIGDIKDSNIFLNLLVVVWKEIIKILLSNSKDENYFEKSLLILWPFLEYFLFS